MFSRHYIKNAIIAFDGQKKNDSLVENIIAALRSELSKVQIPQNSVPFRMTETEDKGNADESMDVADAFLDAL